MRNNQPPTDKRQRVYTEIGFYGLLTQVSQLIAAITGKEASICLPWKTKILI